MCKTQSSEFAQNIYLLRSTAFQIFLVVAFGIRSLSHPACINFTLAGENLHYFVSELSQPAMDRFYPTDFLDEESDFWFLAVQI